MLHFGMPTLLENKNIEESAKLCRELTLSFVELNMNLPSYQPDKIDQKQLRMLTEQFGIYFTLHLDENINCCDFNPYVAKAYLRTIQEAIALAEELDMPILNMHLSQGVYFTMPDEKVYLFDACKETYLESMQVFKETCERAIGKAKIKICLENTDGFPGFQKEALALLLSSPCFGLTYDVGHAYCAKNKDLLYLLHNKAKLYHMHLHDAKGQQCHLPLGEGQLPIQNLLSLAQETNSRICLETKTVKGLRQSVEYLKDSGLN